MRNARSLLAAAALGTMVLGTTAANAASVGSIVKPPPRAPYSGETVTHYFCYVVAYEGITINCDDIECGPRSCDSIDGDRARSAS